MSYGRRRGLWKGAWPMEGGVAYGRGVASSDIEMKQTIPDFTDSETDPESNLY